VIGPALDMSLDASKALVAKMEKEHGKDFRWPVIAALDYDTCQVVSRAIDTDQDHRSLWREDARSRRRDQGHLRDAT
jgi:hypothetical protein